MQSFLFTLFVYYLLADRVQNRRRMQMLRWDFISEAECIPLLWHEQQENVVRRRFQAVCYYPKMLPKCYEHELKEKKNSLSKYMQIWREKKNINLYTANNVYVGVFDVHSKHMFHEHTEIMQSSTNINSNIIKYCVCCIHVCSLHTNAYALHIPPI